MREKREEPRKGETAVVQGPVPCHPLEYAYITTCPTRTRTHGQRRKAGQQDGRAERPALRVRATLAAYLGAPTGRGVS